MILLLLDHGILYKPPKWPVLYDKWNKKSMVVCNLNIEVNGEKQTAFQKTLISQGYTYKYKKAQEKMLDEMYTPTIG